LESVNFKTILRVEYNVAVRYINHTVQITPFPGKICKALRCPPKTPGMLMKIFALSPLKKPVYYQEVYIPPNDLTLHISDSIFIPEWWA
jgi:GntR family transcriptional regulator